jgi:hypothetical protein
MKKIVVLMILCIAMIKDYAQCLVPGGEPDTLFPITNNYNLDYDADLGLAQIFPASIFRIQKRDSSLFLAGNFTNIVSNYGKGILVDEGSQTIITKHKWRVDGEVKAAIPDGQGGYYIAGSFLRVGDSSRKYIAQIDGLGRPTAWKLNIDSTVNAMYKKNDTLYIGGVFKNIEAKSSLAFGAYSISGDSVLPQTLLLPPNPTQINVFKVYNDTLIMAGHGIIKFNMKTLVMIPWTLPISLNIYDIGTLDISLPHRTLFYGDGSPGMYAIDLFTGILKYTIVLKNRTMPPDYGRPNSLLVIGNKLYIGGFFENVYVNTVRTIRKGLCIIDVPTGNLINTDFALDNHVTNLFAVNDKLYVSGFFTTISGTQREHFAELDTATLAVSSWNPSPSDPVRCFLKSNGKMFFGGLMNGLAAIHRNQLAEINIFTNQVMPFNMPPTYIHEVKRFFVKDSNMYLLCTGSQLNALQQRLIVINMNSRQTTTLSSSSNTYQDIAIDEMYLYVAVSKRLVRYGANTLQQDFPWGIDFTNNWGEYYFQYIIPRGDKLYCLGIEYDNPFIEDYANILVVNKSNSQILHDWRYRSNVPPLFDHYNIFSKGVFDNDSILYIQGNFTNLDSTGRNMFVAISANTGAMLEWNPTFQNTGFTYPDYNYLSSPLYYRNNKLWIGTPAIYNASANPVKLPGLEIVDSATAIRLPTIIDIESNERWPDTYYGFVTDMVFDTNYYYLSGQYDLINGKAVTNIMRMGYQSSSPPMPGISSITGSDVIVLNADSMMYRLSNANTHLYSYYWSYTGTGVQIQNNGKDTVWLKANNNATGGILKVRAQNYCGLGSEAQKSLTTGTVDLNITSPSLSSSSVATGNFFDVSFIENNQGTDSAGPNKVNFYLSPNNILTPGSNGDVLLGQYSISTILPGNGNTGLITKQLLMACNAVAGNYFIFIVADGANEIPEGNETNNLVNLPMTVTQGQNAPSIPAVTSTPSTIVCSPNTITLTAISNCTACSYTWNTGVTGTSINVNSSGTYSVTVANNCGTVTASQLVTINPSIIPSITISYAGCPANILTFQAVAVNGGTNPQLQWYVNNVLSGTGQTLILNNATNGTEVYSKLTSNALCPNPAIVNSTTSTINCIVTALPNIDGLEAFKIMPNPGNGLLYVNLKLNPGKKVSFIVKDIFGRQVYSSMPVFVSGTMNKLINMQHLSRGVYFLTTIIGTAFRTDKIIIQ